MTFTKRICIFIFTFICTSNHLKTPHLIHAIHKVGNVATKSENNCFNEKVASLSFRLTLPLGPLAGYRIKKESLSRIRFRSTLSPRRGRNRKVEL
uniref:Uncharacterized protein n=1 Tax=Rhizophora mucronata TaxID=61149 RepID=A0A2P2JQ08_RHIMU